MIIFLFSMDHDHAQRDHKLIHGNRVIKIGLSSCYMSAFRRHRGSLLFQRNFISIIGLSKEIYLRNLTSLKPLEPPLEKKK